MGSHGISGIEEILLGSNTEKWSLKFPFWLLRNHQIQRRTFCIRSDFQKKKPFKKMLDSKKIFDAKLSLVMICTLNNFKTTALSGNHK
jgi:hypothetical protein